MPADGPQEMSVHLGWGTGSVSKGLERRRCSPEGEHSKILKANWEEGRLTEDLPEGNRWEYCVWLLPTALERAAVK